MAIISNAEQFQIKAENEKFWLPIYYIFWGHVNICAFGCLLSHYTLGVWTGRLANIWFPWGSEQTESSQVRHRRY